MKQAGTVPGKSYRFKCSREKNRCSGEFFVTSDDGSSQRIGFVGMCIPGNIYLKFHSHTHDLFVGWNPYLHIPVGEFDPVHQKIDLFEAPDVAATDSPTALKHAPVVRIPNHHVATLDIEASPGADE